MWNCGGFPTDGWMSCNLLMLSSHSSCHLALMCVAISGFRWEWGIRYGSTSQFRAFFAARSTCSFPWMLAWPGTQQRCMSYPSDASWIILWMIFATETQISDCATLSNYKQTRTMYRLGNLWQFLFNDLRPTLKFRAPCMLLVQTGSWWWRPA